MFTIFSNTIKWIDSFVIDKDADTTAKTKNIEFIFDGRINNVRNDILNGEIDKWTDGFSKFVDAFLFVQPCILGLIESLMPTRKQTNGETIFFVNTKPPMSFVSDFITEYYNDTASTDRIFTIKITVNLHLQTATHICQALLANIYMNEKFNKATQAITNSYRNLPQESLTVVAAKLLMDAFEWWLIMDFKTFTLQDITTPGTKSDDSQ